MSETKNIARNITYEVPQLLEIMLQKGASDLHLKPGSPPGFRIDGQLRRLENAPPLTTEEAARLALELVPEKLRQEFEHHGDLDFAFEVRGISRYRACVFRQKGSICTILRRVPVEVPEIDRLGLPEVTKDIAQLPRGLVLVSGPTGCGKSTTLAAMINYLNKTTCAHIVTMEDPIEFMHRDDRCFITQREIGVDIGSYQKALKRVLRQDPDVIMLGELRDLETISLAITAAETGHLVFATLHTTGAVQSVDRILDAFPTEARSQVRIQLSMNLQAVLSQTLVRKKRGGRTGAFEIMLATEATRSCIREGKTHQLTNLVQTGGHLGMRTLDAALAELVRHGLVTEQEAKSKATSIDGFERELKSGGRALRNAATPAPTPTPTADGREPKPKVEQVPVSTPNAAVPSQESILEKLRRS